MASAAFFGHRDLSYAPYRKKIEALLCDLVENHGVTEFYNGYRGNFDEICAEAVFALKEKYPNIKNILVLSYHPKDNAPLPKFFDGSVYWLDKSVPPKFAISYTNQKTMEHADYIVSGVVHDWGGAWTACDFARRKKKTILQDLERKKR